MSTAAQGIFVLGMHRSGTSAVTRIVSLLGVPLGDPADLMPARAENPEGYFESVSLTARNDELLDRLGGSWAGPPTLERRWPADPRLADFREAARATFRAVYATPTWVWKDPRNCVTLPFWLSILDVTPAFVFVWRNPLEVWRSLEKRDGLSKAVSVALWERSVRAASESCAGHPTIVVPYDGLLAEPARWGEAIAAFLRGRGIDADWPRIADEASAFLKPGLRHAVHRTEEATGDPDLSPAQRALVAAFDAKLGAHESFAPPELPPETPSTGPLLAERGRGDSLRLANEAREREIDELRGELGEARAEIVRLEYATVGLLDWAEKIAAAIYPEAPEAMAPPTALFGRDAREDRDGYRAWIAASADRLAAERADVARRLGALGDPPLVSLVADARSSDPTSLRRSLDSLRAQLHGRWELCVGDDGAAGPALAAALDEAAKADSRVRISRACIGDGAAASLTAALTIAAGDVVAPFELGTTLEPEAVGEIVLALAADPALDVVYTDEDRLDAAGERAEPYFKTDWSPDLAATVVFPGSLVAARSEVARSAGVFDPAADGALAFDFALRVTDAARAVGHVAKVLVHRPATPEPATDAVRRALADSAARRGTRAAIERGLVPGAHRVRKGLPPSPKVSIVIPFRDGADLTERCLRTIGETADGVAWEGLLVDNRSAEPETLALLARLEESGCRTIPFPEPFNWAAINNRAVREATGDYFLFLNNDIEAREKGWLAAMLEEAARDDVGAVGARLLYPAGGVQHAGIVLGMGGVADHAFRHCPPDRAGYFGLAKATRDVSAVTGACLMVRRAVFESLGGFDESFPLAFNDIDFCLRIRERGLRVIYTPYAELVHHESVTRGLSRDLPEIREMLRRWPSVIARDPFFNPNLSLRRTEFALRGANEVEPWKDLQSMLESS